MTDEETLKEVEWNVANLPAFAGSVATRAQVKSLMQDSRDLRSLLEALPKCVAFDCNESRPGTYSDGYSAFCDHHAKVRDGKYLRELPYAPILRRLAP